MSPWETIVRQHPSKTHYQAGYRELNEWIEQQDTQPEISLAATFPHQLRFRKRSDHQTQADDKTEPQDRGNDDEVTQDATSQHATSTADFADQGIELDKQQSRNLHHEPSQSTHDQSQLNLDASHNAWANIRTKHKRVLAEFLGTALVIFIGICANLAYVTSKGQHVNLLTVDLAWGFAVMIGIYVSGGPSGGFLSPSITIMLSVLRGFPAKRVPSYIVAEVFGAFVGAILAYAIYRDNIMHLHEGLIPESTGIYFYTQPQPWITPLTAFFNEFLVSAVLGCAVMALGDSGNSPPGAGMHAFIIGLVVTTCTVIGSYSTSACLNPARDFGPRLATMALGYPRNLFTAYHNWWIWGPWGADVTGALMGGFIYDIFIFPGSESPVNFSLWRYKMEMMKREDDMLRRLGRSKRAEQVERKIEEGLGAVNGETLRMDRGRTFG
ncbi:hypothetical protein LTS10_002117 [Elasticomyces elasticus]|nr:hypothetical protein LTS10_002117 [Elasticomyces elasticus]